MVPFLIISSNNLFGLFKAAGQASATIYGGDNSSGVLGISWDNKFVGGGADRGYRPSPVITGFEFIVTLVVLVSAALQEPESISDNVIVVVVVAPVMVTIPVPVPSKIIV